jgi:beta-galactosidase GanA
MLGRLLLALALLVAPAVSARAQDDVLIGTDYQPDASEEVKALFQRAGFNYARLTGGGYEWSLERHIAAARELQERGVRVLLQLGSHYPSGAYFRFTDSWLVDHKGETGREDRQAWAISYSGSNWPQYSYASEETREQFARDFTSYLGRIGGSASIAGVCLHNEPGLHWLRERIFDYSPPARRRFRAWLEERYGGVAALNAAWGTDHTSFDAVEPPRDEPPVGNMAAWLDWRRANTDFIAEFLRWEQALVRCVRPGLPLTTNMAGPVDWWHAWRCSDNSLFTEGMDIAGVDIYPGPYTTRQHCAYTMDMTRGVARGRPVHVLECEVYGPEKWPDLSAEQRAAMLRSEVWTYLGHGARGVLPWGLSGRGDNNLTEGEWNPRLEVMRGIVERCRALGLKRFRSEPPRVAVVIDPDSYLYFTGAEEEPPYWLDKESAGLYGAVREAGYAADVIFAEQPRRGAALDYEVLVIAGGVMMDEALARRLAEFVRDGGLLVAEAPFAEVDRTGRPLPEWPGFGLDEVFGVRVTADGADPGVVRTAAGEITGWRFRRRLEPRGAAVAGRFADGTPAVAINDYGGGRAVYLATTAGVAYCDGWNSWARMGLRHLLGSLLGERLPATARLEVTHGGEDYLDVGRLADADGNRLIVLAPQPHRGEPFAPVPDVSLRLPAESVAGLRSAWALGPGDAPPRRLQMARQADSVRLEVGTVESAAVLLLSTQDAPPEGLR